MNEVEYRKAEMRLWDAVGLTPTETLVTLPRLGVKVRVQEIGEGEPVLFVHGGPNAGSTWAPMIEHLVGVRALLVDRPGTGLSEPYEVGPANLAHYGRVFVGDVLDGLGIESAHVVASSFGGMLSLYSSAAEPQRFRRMVQMACPAMAPGQQVPPFMRLMTVGLVRRLLGALPPNERAGDAILRQIGHGASLDAGRIPQIFKDWYLALQRHTDTMENDGNMIGRLGTLSGFPDSLTIPDEVLSAVETPTLFLWGTDDGFGGPEVARDVVSKMPAAELVLMPEAGHLPWLDDPRVAAQATMAFLESDVVQDAVARAERR